MGKLEIFVAVCHIGNLEIYFLVWRAATLEKGLDLDRPITANMETTSTTLDWAMVEMLLNPHIPKASSGSGLRSWEREDDGNV